jgi:hypothetical protein
MAPGASFHPRQRRARLDSDTACEVPLPAGHIGRRGSHRLVIVGQEFASWRKGCEPGAIQGRAHHRAEHMALGCSATALRSPSPCRTPFASLGAAFLTPKPTI